MTIEAPDAPASAPPDQLEQVADRISKRLGETQQESQDQALDNVAARIEAVTHVEPPSLAEKLITGAARSLGDMAQAPDLALKALEHVIPRETLLQQIPNIKAAAEWLSNFGQQLQGGANVISPPGSEDQSALGQLPYQLGGLAPLLATSAIGGELGAGLEAAVPALTPAGALMRVGQPVGQILGAAAAGAAQTAVPMYHDVLAATGSEYKAMVAAALGMGIGALQAVGVGGILAKLERGSSGGLMRWMTKVATGAVEQGALGAAQQTLQDAARTSLTGEDMSYLDRLERSGHAGLLGLVLGGTVSGLFHAPEALPGARQERGAPRSTGEPSEQPIVEPGAAQEAVTPSEAPVSGESSGQGPVVVHANPSLAERQPSAATSAAAGTTEPLLYAHTEDIEPEAHALVGKDVKLSPVQAVPIADIERTQKANFRSGIDPERVAALQESMSNGEPLPPMTGIRTPDGKVMVIQGNHRLEAADALGFEDVPMRLVEPPSKGGGGAAPLASTADVAGALGELVREFSSRDSGENDLPGAMQRAERVLAQREDAGGKPTELDDALRELVRAAKLEPEIDLEPRKTAAQAAYGLAALKKARAVLGAHEHALEQPAAPPPRARTPEEQASDRILRGEHLTLQELEQTPGAIRHASVRAQRGERPPPEHTAPSASAKETAKEAVAQQPTPPPADREIAPAAEAQAPAPSAAAQEPLGAASARGGPIEPPANPSEPPKSSEPETTGIKNATVERELAAMQLPPPEHGESVSDVERHARAMETLRRDPRAGEKLVSDLEAAPRPPDADEGALLALEVNRLIVEREAAEEAYNADPSEANRARIDNAIVEYARAADVVTRAGTHSAQALRIRRMMVARDYSLAEMERSVQVAKGAPLTDAERANVRELHDKLAAAAKTHAEYVSAAEQKRAELEAENALLKLKSETATKARRTKRAASIEQTKKELDDILTKLAQKGRQAGAQAFLDPETIALTFQAASKAIKLGAQHFATWAEEIVNRVGEHVRPYLRQAWDDAQTAREKELAAPIADRLAKGQSITDLHRQAQEIAEHFVEQGITDREQLVDAVHRVLQHADPAITRRETMDAISGYGDFRPLSKDETKAKLRDLKGQLQQVAKLEDLQAGIPPLKSGPERRTPSDAERALIKQVNDLKRRLGIRVTDPETQLKSALEARKTYLKNRIADLEDQITRGDFAPRPKRPPLALDVQATKLKADYEETRRKFETLKRMHELANRTRTRKVLDAAKEAINLPKALMTAWDFSAAGRQGGFFSLAHPVTTATVLIPRMFRATFSERGALEHDVALRNRPLYATGEAAGLQLTDLGGALSSREEAIQSALSDKIPGIRASNRAFITFLNQQRAFIHDSMVQAMPHPPSMEELRAIANAVNVGTGRGNPGRFAGAMQAAAVPLWAPRLILSRFQLLAGQPLYHGTAATRALIAKEYARFLIGIAGVYGLAKVAGLGSDKKDEPTISADPTTADFGKIKIGDTRIDPLAGLSQVTVLLSRLGKDAFEAMDLVQKGKKESDAAETIGRFLRSKLSPTLGVPLDVLAGKNAVGEPVTPASAAEELLVPLSFQDIRKAMQERGVPAGAALGILGTFGVGLQTYGAKKPAAALPLARRPYEFPVR